jgi:sugar phosphate isomerase/epimerase
MNKLESLTMPTDRRRFMQTVSAGALSLAGSAQFLHAASSSGFQFSYLVGSSMYGYASLADILPEVAKTGSKTIDIWPKVHGNQREQLDEMGEAQFSELLKKHDVSLGCITQYQIGPFALQEEMKLAQRFGCKTIVTGAKGPANLKGDELKKAVAKFIEEMKPHLEVAEATNVTIAIENHAKNLIESPDSLRWLAELSPGKNLGIAFAPYHLPQEEKLLADLLGDIFDRVAVFYAWQHGNGCMTKLPKEEELLQMPGRGNLDFTSMISVLKAKQYSGWTEIFMHPFPRGIPILETTTEVTGEINRARSYLDKLIQSA